MEYEKIKQLMDDMGNSKLTSIDIEFPDGIKISMKKDVVVKEKVVSEKATADNNIAIENNVVVENDNKESKGDEGNVVKSPMVGTFYSKSAPTAKSFVKVGDKVIKGQTLCIIEAMKLMNEIESEYDGEVVEVCVKDDEMVEFGQVLFKIK